jgi:signal transduction histidine kinase
MSGTGGWRTRWRAAHRRWHNTHRRWRHSLKWRLLTVFLLLALATTGVFLLGMQRVLQGGWQGYAKPIVADYLDRLALELGTPPDPSRAAALTQRLPISVQIEGPQVQFDSHPQMHRYHPYRDAGEEREYGAQSWGLVRTTADGHRITFGLAGPLAVDRPRIFGWLTLGALLLLTALAFAYVRKLLRPLDSIGAGVTRFGQGRFDAPIAVQRNDELGDLAQRINAMARSLQGMLDAKRALLLAISHELRSPLTRARINTELLDETPERSALLRDLGEMRDLITTLLESERLAQGHQALQAEPTDLAALTREVAGAQSQAIELDLDETLGLLQVDPQRVRLLLRNLLANAARHAADASAPPTLYLQPQANGQLALGLRDHGPGVPAEVLPQLAQAFYRPDAARTRSAGGVGLGLHLCRLVAQAHGGELRVQAGTSGIGLDVAMVWQRPEPESHR